jgi:hypothetical protein
MVGLIALVQNDFYVATRDYPFKFDATTWAGSTCWACPTGPGPVGPTVGADLGAGGRDRPGGPERDRQLPVSPLLPAVGMLIIALDVFVIWALTVHGRELGEAG